MPLCCIMRPSTGCRRCPNPELIWRFATGQIKRTGALSSTTAAALDGILRFSSDHTCAACNDGTKACCQACSQLVVASGDIVSHMLHIRHDTIDPRQSSSKNATSAIAGPNGI